MKKSVIMIVCCSEIHTHTRTQRTPASQAVSGDQSSQEASQWQSTTTLQLYCMLDLDEEALATSCLCSPNLRAGVVDNYSLAGCEGGQLELNKTSVLAFHTIQFNTHFRNGSYIYSIINRARGSFFKTFYMYLDVEFFKQKTSQL